MPDSSSLPLAEGGQARGGKTNWFMIGAIGVGGIILLMLLMRGGGGGAAQTTDAGTSINAALGSIQEQELNIMGLVSQGDARLSSEMDTNTSTIVGGQKAATDRLEAIRQAQRYLADQFFGLPGYGQLFEAGGYSPYFADIGLPTNQPVQVAGIRSADDLKRLQDAGVQIANIDYWNKLFGITSTTS